MSSEKSYVFYGWGDTGPELWVTDGTAAGTRVLKEFKDTFHPDYGYPEGGYPHGFTDLADGRVLFTADSPAGSNELWVTNGTEAGTQRIPVPGLDAQLADDAQYGQFHLADGRVLFRGMDVAHGFEYWATDGTAEGTELFKDLAPGADPSVPESATALGDGRFVFSALAQGRAPDNYDRELYVSDGTPEGTHLLVDYVPGTDTPLNPQEFIALGNGKVLFASDMPPDSPDSAPPGKLFWLTDGTAEGTVRIPQLTIDQPFTWPQSQIALEDGRVAFLVPAADGAYRAWVSDGTVEGTRMVADLPVYKGDLESGGLRQLCDGHFLFQVQTAEGVDLWQSDGTTNGTVLLRGGLAGDHVNFLQLEDDKVLFTVNETTDGTVTHTTLWLTDGTEVGTVQLQDMGGAALSSFYGAAQKVGEDLWIFGGSEDDRAGNTAAWATNAQPGGTHLLTAADIWINAEGGPIFFDVPGAESGLPAQGGDIHYWSAANPLLDEAFYRTAYLDVMTAGLDPAQHFATIGWHEGRDPNSDFDVSFYLNQNPDVAAAGVNPLEHYMTSGWKEGRAASLSFDSKAYLAANGDVAAAGVNPLEHYLHFGEAEGRAAPQAVAHATGPQGPLVGADFYFAAYPDVARAGIDPTQHFMSTGWKEGRDPDPFFDTDWYLTLNPDVAAAGVNPVEHYLAFGAKEGRDPSAAFDGEAYLAANPDVAAAGVNPLEHYLQHGLAEGREIFAV